MDYKRILSYYEKLEFNKIESWSEKDLAQFLVWDYIETINEYEYCPNTQNRIVARFLGSSKRYKKYNFFKYLIDNIYNKFLRIILAGKNRTQGVPQQKILFNISISDKYLPIISAPRNNYNVEMIVWGMRDRLFTVKNFIVTDSFSNISQFVYDYLIKRDTNYLYALIDNVKETIKNINPNYIILWGDCLPIERAIVAVAKSFGIVTLEIQHGMYDSSYPLETGKVADYVLVWGKYYKDLYVKQDLRKPEDLYILGYPCLIEAEKITKKKNSRYTVYYLGQDLEEYNKEFLNIKIETVKKINEICNRLGMNFIYRPHPKDNRPMLKEKLPEICFSPKREKIEDSIPKGDIFISCSSTSLIEAAMRSKISLQLINYPIKSDNLEHLGVCSKSFNTIEELENYLAKISNAQNFDEFKIKFNNDYIETRYNPGERFLEIIKEISLR